MREIVHTNKFKRDVKKCIKRGLALDDLLKIVNFLANGIELEEKHKPHTLSGHYSGFWECHIKSDWLLIYSFGGNALNLIRTGTHSDLFN